ncbi:uncharacterized protein [Epargyreus clarus]|uniref:uncharacterized protein n=1 Tax=Epargyreus clarus TaxID=520877 RepID=UPI003C2FF9FF
MDSFQKIYTTVFVDESQIEEELAKVCEEIEINNELIDICRQVESAIINQSSQHDKESLQTSCLLENPTNQHQQVGGAMKRSSYDIDSPKAKRIKVNEGASTSSDINLTDNGKVMCDVCQRLVSKRYFANHIKSNIHKNNIFKSHSTQANVSVIESAFGQRIISYRIKSKLNESVDTLKTPELFFNSIKDNICSLIEESIKMHILFKINFILHANFTQQTKDLTNTFDFQTCNYTVSQGDDLNIFFSSLIETLSNKISSFEKKDSGWSLTQIKHLEMNINKFNPLRGTSYIDLPHDIKVRKAVINVQNADNMCFKWALLSALYPTTSKSNRVSSYSMHSNKLNFNGISFPVKLSDVPKIEKLNNISINIFGLEYNREKKIHDVIGPLIMTKFRKSVHINLLYLKKGLNAHFCYIKNMSRLVSKQISNQEHAIFLCDGCLLHFPTQQRLDDHQENDCAHIKTNIPDGTKTLKDWFGKPAANNKIKFENFNNKLKLPFVIYADFEAFLKPINVCSNDPSRSYTENIQKHDVYSFGYYIKCSYDDTLSKFETYSGPDCATEFMKRLYEDLKLICTKNIFQMRPKPLSSDDENNLLSESKICHVCETNLNEDKHFDFDFHTGTIRGVVHEICLKKFKTPRYIPVFLHNLSHYDAHFIVHALNFVDGEVKIIPQNKERYISFSKTLTVNNNQISLRFVDSYKFLSCSLDQLAKNLSDEQFHDLKRNFPCNDDFTKLRRKGIYPYEFMTSYDSLKLKSLPTQSEFYSSLTDSNVSDDDYNRANEIWKHFRCQNMLDYSNLYLKTDVLLLTDVFENFRELCIKTYGLDPAHYYTAPGLSWDAMLKYTKIELDLLMDYEQIAFFKAGIRGGVSQCSNRYAKANNQFMEDYDKNEPQSYLIYLDANNLYGWAMSQYLPTGDFEWVNPETNFNVSDTSNIGYVLEVDLKYPDDLHDLHSDLPLCPENICIGNSKDIKLISNLNDKIKYKIHYKNLKQCLSMGMKVTKIHRILKFKQSPWLEKYIDLNTNMRTLAKSVFEKDFYKLMNNSVFGKTMENIEKRVNVKLLTHWENRGKILGVNDYIARPDFKNLSIFTSDLVAVQMLKCKLNYNKPIYLGFCILDISKTLMYEFHYNYMIPKFQNKNKLLYTDTDSLIYQIFTNNFYEDIKPDLKMHFDSSDYPSDNIYGYPQVNKKKIGFFKDENNGKIFREFVGLRSKMYAIDVENKFVAKAKGVNKSVTKNMQMHNYKACLFEKNIQFGAMLRFKSIKHKIYTQKINKKCLSYSDTKRHILSNGIDTLAWGHYKLR